MLLEVVEEIAAPLVDRGAATLEEEWEDTLGWSGPTLRLKPHNPAAAAVELGADLDATYVIVGDHQLQHELWDAWPEARREPLRECLEAIVDGRVSDTRKRHWSGPMDVLVFETEAEPFEIRWYRVNTESEPYAWTTSYEAY